MRFQVRQTYRFPAEQVFRTQRDELEAVVGHLPDVRGVRLLRHDRAGDGTETQSHEWSGSGHGLPLLVRAVASPEMLRWRQTTVWSPGPPLEARWEIDVPGLGAAVFASGTNQYLAADDGSVVDINGSFSFRPGQAGAGGPGWLARVPAAAVPQVERVVVQLVVPMIERTVAAVGQYLEDRSARRR